MFDVVTIGSATRDVYLISSAFIKLESNKFETGVGECMSLGSKIELDSLMLSTGGGATNAAATFGSLGFNTATISRIGDDAPGKDVVAALNKFNVSTKFIKVIKKGQTGFSTLLTMKDGERTALVYRGVSANFKSKDLNNKIFEQTKWIYITSLNGNISIIKKILKQAHKNNVKIAWNPGNVELSAGMKTFEPLLPFVDILNMNKEEGKLLTGKKTIKTILERLATKDKVRLITDGKNGTTALYNKTMLFADTTGTTGISSTGAGDAFGSGFLSGILKTDDIKYALALGTLNAESVIQKIGAKNGLLKTWPTKRSINSIKITEVK